MERGRIVKFLQNGRCDGCDGAIGGSTCREYGSYNQLVENNIGLVWNIVKRYTGRGYDQEDIFRLDALA